MVISSTLTAKLDDVRAPIPLSRTRPRSMPTYTSKTPTGTPSPSRLGTRTPQHHHHTNQHHHHHQQHNNRPSRRVSALDKPPFINYASAYINPYRSTSPIFIHHPSRRRHRSRSKTPKGRLSKHTPVHDQINFDESKRGIEENLILEKLAKQHPAIDIHPIDPSAFDASFCRKRQMIIDNPYYREKVDSWKVESIHHLTKLIQDLTLEHQLIDRLWLMYYWICQNIQYDIDTDFMNRHRHQRAEDVFRSGKSTCEGFASICKTVCDNLNIPCEKIRGFAKDFFFKIDKPTFTDINHTWNAVKLHNNRWYLLDMSWGTGYIDDNHKYKKDLKPHYFLTHPEHMIYNHLPENAQWQLLSKPILMDDYVHLPHIHSYYFIYSITIIYPRFSSIVSFNTNQWYAEVLIQAPDNIHLTCSVKNNLHSSSLAQYDINRQVWQCLFMPSTSDFHTLIVFAKQISTVASFKNIIELGVMVPEKQSVKRKTLPITFGKFSEHKCQIVSPLDGILKHGTKVTIHCRIPHASCARISLDGVWLDEVPLKNETLKQKVNVPEQEIMIYARFSRTATDKTYDGLVRYIVEK